MHIADLVGLLHTLGAAPAHLVGNSWGAFICLLTAIEHPEVVRSPVLEATARLTPQRGQQMHASAAELQAEFRAGFPPLAEPDVRGVRAPALLLTGEHSPTIERALSQWRAELLPDAEQVVVPDASHLMPEDNAVFVNDAVLRFVTGR